MDNQSMCHPPSGQAYIRQRIVVPKLQMDGVFKNKPQPLDSRIVMKSSGVPTKLKREKDGEGKVASPLLPPTSQAYETYLTEIEFKIRYMKNDIEYKQEQIRKRGGVNTNTSNHRSQIPHQTRGGLLKGSRNLTQSSLRRDSKSSQNPPFSHSPQSASFGKHSKSIPHKVLHQNSKMKSKLQLNSPKTVALLKDDSNQLKVDPQTSQAISRVTSSTSSSASVHPRVASTSSPSNSPVVSSAFPIVSRFVVSPSPSGGQDQSRHVPSSIQGRVVLSSVPSRSRVVVSSASSHPKAAVPQMSSVVVSTPVPVNPRLVSSSVHVNSRIVSHSVSAKVHSHVATSSSSAPVNFTVGSSTSVNSKPREASTSAVPVYSKKVSTSSAGNLNVSSSSVPSHSTNVSMTKPSQSKAIISQSSMQNPTSGSFSPKLTSPVPSPPRNERKVIVLWQRGQDKDHGRESRSRSPETSKKNLTTNNPMAAYPTYSRSSSELSSKLASLSPASSAQNSTSRYKYVASTPTVHTHKGFASSSSQLNVPPGHISSVKPSFFHNYHNQAVPVSSVIQVQNINRKTSCETKSVKKITPLKVKTAAKLVSKYKWKRASPTSVSKMAPSFSIPGRSSVGHQKKVKTLIDHSSSKFRKVNLFKIDKRKLMSDLAKSKSHTFTAQPNKSTPLKTLERKCKKSRFSLKYTGQPSAKMSVKQRNAGYASVFPAVGSLRHKHHWASVEERTKYLKKCLAAKRHAALSRFRWKSSKPGATDQSVTPVASRFKWSQTPDALNKNRLSQLQLQKYFMSGPSRISARTPFPSHHLQKSAKLVMIGGVVYRSSPRSLRRAVQHKRRDGKVFHQNLIHGRGKSHLIANVKPQNVKLIHVRGVRYHSDARGKKLCRAFGSGVKKGVPTVSSLAGLSLKSPKLNVEKSTDIHKKAAASRAIHRSLAYVAAKHKKDNRLKKGKQRNCMFFCRFGKCHRGDSCPYVHDPNKVVVCTRFLRGKCDVKNCLFSHDASFHKMPVCLYYLQGLCSREDCLYLHVNVSPSAPPCKDFLQGFCALGKKCKKLHSFLCPSFAVFGKCSKGDKCTLLHRHSKKSPVAFLSNPKPRSGYRLREEKVEDQGTTKSLPVVSFQNDSSIDSSILAVEESDPIPQNGKPSPLKSQPAFISLPSLKQSHVMKANGVKPNVESSREKKPKIKPEFSQINTDETQTNSEGSEATINTAERITASINSQGSLSDNKSAIKADRSGYINLSSSLDSGFIRVESSEPSREDDFQESSSTSSQVGAETSQSPNTGQKISPKPASSKAMLLKGIIPNFLPSSVPIRKAPGSQ